MNKPSPVELRTALSVAEAYKDEGVMFVPMPVFTETEKQERIQESYARLRQEEKRQKAQEKANDA